MFNVGDIVERTQGSHVGMHIGDTGTVVEVNQYGDVHLKEYQNGIYHAKEKLKLVKANKNSWTYKIRDISEISMSIISSELSPKKPVALVQVDDYNICAVVIHNSLFEKVLHMFPEESPWGPINEPLTNDCRIVSCPIEHKGALLGLLRKAHRTPWGNGVKNVSVTLINFA